MEKFEIFVEKLRTLRDAGEEFIRVGRDYSKFHDEFSEDEIAEFYKKFGEDDELKELSDSLNQLWKDIEDEL